MPPERLATGNRAQLDLIDVVQTNGPASEFDRHQRQIAPVLLVDDEVLTGGSAANAVDLLRKEGAHDVYFSFSHALLAGEAIERLRNMDLKEIVTTNTLPVRPDQVLPNMKILSVGPMLGEVIMRAHEGRSVGELFNE